MGFINIIFRVWRLILEVTGCSSFFKSLSRTGSFLFQFVRHKYLMKHIVSIRSNLQNHKIKYKIKKTNYCSHNICSWWSIKWLTTSHLNHLPYQACKPWLLNPKGYKYLVHHKVDGPLSNPSPYLATKFLLHVGNGLVGDPWTR